MSQNCEAYLQMEEIPIEQIKKIIEIKESLKYRSFIDFYSSIEKQTNDLPLIQREQYRLFCLFCLYQIYKPKSRSSHLPEQILKFHTRLLSDRFKLTSEQIQQRWKDFGINSPCFMNSLEIVANGDPDLCRFINFIKTPPTGGDFMEFLNQNSTNLKNVLEYNPEYLSFIPKKIPGDLNIHSLITEEEYEQVNLI